MLRSVVWGAINHRAGKVVHSLPVANEPRGINVLGGEWGEILLMLLLVNDF